MLHTVKRYYELLLQFVCCSMLFGLVAQNGESLIIIVDLAIPIPYAVFIAHDQYDTM